MMSGDHDGPERFALEWRDMVYGVGVCTEVCGLVRRRG